MDRQMVWWCQGKFLSLLLALGMLMIVYALLRNAFSTRILLDVLFMVVFLAAFSPGSGQAAFAGQFSSGGRPVLWCNGYDHPSSD
jgi:hypothetical protein